MKSKFKFAQTLVREAGNFVKNKMTESLEIEEKSDFTDLVTHIDKETQDFIINRIQTAYPADCFFAEEGAVYQPISQGNVWVIDPIDGTVNFVVQQDYFAIMIAYYENGQGCFGLIYDVMQDVLYSGGGEFDVYANDRRLSSYEMTPFHRTLMVCNATMYAANYRGLATLAQDTLGVRIYGSAGIGMIEVMTRHLLGYFSYIQPWDYAAAMIMGEKLGYTLLTFDGKAPNFKTREHVMFVPKEQVAEIYRYVTK